MATTNPLDVNRTPPTSDRKYAQPGRGGLSVIAPIRTTNAVVSIDRRNLRAHYSDTWANQALCAGLSIFDECGVGLVVCDSACTVLSANRVARRIASTRNGLEINANNVLIGT